MHFGTEGDGLGMQQWGVSRPPQNPNISTSCMSTSGQTLAVRATLACDAERSMQKTAVYCLKNDRGHQLLESAYGESVNPSPLGDGSQCKDELFSNNYPGYEKLNSFSLRDACSDAGVRAQHGAIAGKARMRGYESGRSTYDLLPSP